MSALSQRSQVEPGARLGSQAFRETNPQLSASRTQLRAYFDALFAANGPQHWWPGRTPFEIIVGAILVQNTSWTNVATTIEKLRRAKLLTPGAIDALPTRQLARLIRSSGYFRQKTKTLKNFVRFLRREYQGSLTTMFRAPTRVLREQLLAVHGIGPETADSILLYAAKHPVFVIDAYTRRILERHGLADATIDYEDVQKLFEDSLSHDVALYNEFHALIVHTGKHFCRPRNPRCGECPLKPLLPATTRAEQYLDSLPHALPDSFLLEPLPNRRLEPSLKIERTTAAT